MPINARRHAAKPLFEAPATTPTINRCLSIQIPDSDEWLLMLTSALSTMSTWLNYERSGTTRETEVAQKWREIIHEIIECPEWSGYIMPLGTIVPNVGYLHDPDDNSGMLSCDGTTYDKVDYPELWQWMADAVANGAAWTVGTDTFAVPNLNDPKRFVRGAITAFGIISETGLTDGADTHTLTEAEIPAHTHNFVTRNNGTIGATAPLGGTGGSLSNARETEAAGGGNAHNNVPASMRIPYYIVARPQALPAGQKGDPGDIALLRQNLANPFLLEQSQNSGDTWDLAFDYSLIQDTKTDIQSILDLWQEKYPPAQTIINNFVTINITYPDLVYNGDNDLRDRALCVAMYIWLAQVLTALAEARKEPTITSDPFKWFVYQVDAHRDILITAPWVLWQVGKLFGILAVGSLPMLVAVGVAAAAYIVSELVDVPEDTFFSEALFNDLHCCAYNALRGETLTLARFSTAFSGCSYAGDPETVRAALDAAFNGNLDMYIGFLEIFNAVHEFTDIAELPCPCSDFCYTWDFSTTASGWVPVVGGGVDLAAFTAPYWRAVFNDAGGTGDENSRCYIEYEIPGDCTIQSVAITYEGASAINFPKGEVFIAKNTLALVYNLPRIRYENGVQTIIFDDIESFVSGDKLIVGIIRADIAAALRIRDITIDYSDVVAFTGGEAC